MTELQILWSVLGAIGTLMLTLIGAGIIAQVKATIKNTKELAVLSSQLQTIVEKTNKISKLEDDMKTLGLLYRDQKDLVNKFLGGQSNPQTR